MDCNVIQDVNMSMSRDSNSADEVAPDNFRTIQTFFVETEKISRNISFAKSDLGSLSIFSTLRPYQRDTVHWMIDKEHSRKYVQSKNNVSYL